MPEVAFVTGLWGFWLVSTWLGLFGHELQKPTKLLTNMPGAQKHLIQIYRLLMSSKLTNMLFFVLHTFILNLRQYACNTAQDQADHDEETQSCTQETTG